MDIVPYVRKPFYYETDQMGVIHHANYIRWFEESRVDLMEQAGYPYARMEAEGIVSPLLSVTCVYREPVRFGDTVRIHPVIEQFNGVRMTVSYRILDAASGTLKTTGESKHCFSRDGRPVSLKKARPALWEFFAAVMETQKGGKI